MHAICIALVLVILNYVIKRFSAIGLVWANHTAFPVVPDYAECYCGDISDKTKIINLI